jgi:methoxymalonate biosynthesis acyl carrier protein
MEERKSAIKTFIAKFVRIHDLNDNQDIFQSGSVNSLFAMQLVIFLEKKFNIKVENDDLSLENFRTINNIESFVEKKLVG